MKTKPEKIILASGNKKKIAELRLLLKPMAISVIPQTELNIQDAEETGLTFVENAFIKARHAASCSGLPALADDSGLEVDALDGQPGIYSARFAYKAGIGDAGNDSHNNQFLLKQLEQIPQTKRSARFQCVLVFLRHAEDPTPIICQGTWEGSILLSAQGDNGFGYDPLFHVPSHQCSAAMLDTVEKGHISHRGQAMRELLQKFQVLYG